ncbi:hypothetical protein [Pseudoclavibacter sp. Z016]|uniref:hypothetical protein n=1 Tax=Pseudoclavibacter sp. Z016 TaxID=2080581 RepID=UPI0011B0ABDA|nr:hypothetical protein [Pseudoclavibacter sp. Z016]
MTPPFLRPPSTSRIWLWTAVTAILISLALAPVYTSATCLDALDPAHTSCEVSQLGFAGNQTNGWLWLAAVIATIAVGWILARRRRSQPRR